MPDLSTLLIFITATMVLLITPGPAVLYIVARSIDQGRTAGLVSILGIHVGTLFHIIAAALGISALLMSSALAFHVVKYLGAAYLIYLGVRKLLEHDQPEGITLAHKDQLSRVFYQGIIVNVLNPKTALFFFAFLPQFVDPTRGPVVLQIVFLGLIFIVLGILSDGTYAILAGTVRHWLRSSRAVIRAQRYFAGSIYIVLGLATAAAGTDHS